MIATNRITHEAVVIPMAIKDKKFAKYRGCLENRYAPFVTGLSFGVVIKFIRAVIRINKANKKITSPI